MKKLSLRSITYRLGVRITLLTVLTSIATDIRGTARLEFTETEKRTEQQSAQSETRELKLGEPIERELSVGAAHSYTLVVTKGHYIKVVVEQKKIDVVVRLFTPDGKQVAEVDSPNGDQGPEPLLVVVESAGECRLEVKSLEDKAPTGRYEIRLEELREATAKDRDRIQAERVLVEAHEARTSGAAPSLRTAIEKLKDSLSLWRGLEDRKKESEVLNLIGFIYALLSENQNALDYHSQAASLRRALGDLQGEGESLHNMGVDYSQLGNTQKALETYNQALPLERAAGDHRLEARTLGAIGVTYDNLGRILEALEFYNRALVTHRTLGDPRAEATALNNIGTTYYSLGEWQKALDYRSQALALIRTFKDQRQEARALHNIGVVYDQLGDAQKALDYLNQALQLWRTTGFRAGEAMTLNSMGTLHNSMEDRQAALEYFNQALALNRSLANRRGEAFALQSIGVVYLWLGDTQKALDLLNQALSIQRAGGDRLAEAATLSSIGKTYSLLGKQEEALPYLEQALSLQRAIGTQSGEAETLRNIARVEQSRGRLEVARTQIEQALNILESARSKFVGQQLRTSFSASRQNFYEFHINLLMQMHRQRPAGRYDVAALEASERARARSLLEMIAEARVDIRQGVDAALVERERSVQQQLNAKSDRLTRLLSGKPSEEQASAAKKDVENILRDYEDVAAQIRAQSPRYAALTQPQPLTLKEIQLLLDQDTLLLEYALGEERSFLWAVTPTSIKSFELPKRAEIDAQSRRVHELLTTRTDTLHPEVLAGLSQTLLGSVSDQLGNKRLLIVTQGALQHVPFGALPAPSVTLATGPNRGSTTNKKAPFQPLIVNHEIVSLPSASVMAVLRRDLSTRTPAPNKLAVMADPVFQEDDQRIKRGGIVASPTNGKPSGSDNGSSASKSDIQRSASDPEITSFDRLPVSRREAVMITARMPKGHFLKALDFAASRETARNPELGQYQIVHFATHNLINNQHPELSGIVLSLVDESGQPQDGFLRLHEIYNMKLGADLVVLSACQTALGKDIRGEGLIGLTRGFMYAGSPRVVATLWKVSDAATAEFMSRFYQNMLGKELSPAASLRAAQLSMRREKQWAAPYYWAGFVLQGEWR